MCGRYTLTRQERKLQERYGIIDRGDRPAFLPRYNISPTQDAPVILMQGSSPELLHFRWGLIPSWAKDASIGNSLINARSETASTKPAFRHAFKRRRCLALADGFYEWQRTGKFKQPFWIFRKDREPFAIAGLWEHWQNADGTELNTFSILTTGPNALMEPIHNRMPVILDVRGCDQWLDVKSGPELLTGLLKPFAAEEMDCHPVSSLVNSPQNDNPHCTERPSTTTGQPAQLELPSLL